MSGSLPLYACIEGRSKYRRVWRAGSKKSGIRARLGLNNGDTIAVHIAHDADGKFKASIVRESPRKAPQTLYQGTLE